MLNLLTSLADPQVLLSVFAAIAVFATVMTLAMPVLQKDDFGNRMKTVAIERDKIRARERARLAEQAKKGSLKQSSNGFLQDVVDKMKLKSALADDGTAASLTMAGYRQQSHLTVFLVLRVGLPLVFAAAALFYLFVISNEERTVFMNFAVAFFAAAAGFYLPIMLLKNKISKRQLSIRRAWPDALDLMLICVESGMSLEATMKKVAVEVGIQSPELAEELTLTTAELSYLQERRQAHENFAKRTGLEQVKAVTMALIQAERYGTPLATALRALSQESRDMRMAEAEKKAASLPPKLTVPMIVFFLPVLFAVILGPAAIQISEM
ncbi:MAG: type II secretion system F family protein [Rhizobiaceae bacterium]|nr:type II secretion system F family protein [Rhizobiaceae bacterium]